MRAGQTCAPAGWCERDRGGHARWLGAEFEVREESDAAAQAETDVGRRTGRCRSQPARIARLPPAGAGMHHAPRKRLELFTENSARGGQQRRQRD
jgi:hypothetical protein